MYLCMYECMFTSVTFVARPEVSGARKSFHGVSVNSLISSLQASSS